MVAEALPTGLDHLSAHVAKTPEGRRNGTLHWAACKAYSEGYSQSQAEDTLVHAAMASGLPMSEAVKTINSAYMNTMPGKPRSDRAFNEWLAGPELAADIALWEAETGLKAGYAADQKPSGILRIDAYRETVPTFIEWVARPFIYRGGVTLVSAPPKAGKSTLMAQIQKCRETGETFLGEPVEEGPSLLITEEGGTAVLHKSDGLEDLYIYDRRAAEGEPFEATLDKAASWICDHPTGVIFIDTLAIWAGIDDENDASKTTAAIAKVMLLAQQSNAPVVIVHHSRKASGSNGEAIRGSGAILATVDISMELKRTNDKQSDDRYLDIQGRVILPERFLLSFDRMTRSYEKGDLDIQQNAEIEDHLKGIPTDQHQDGFTRLDLQELWGIQNTRPRTEHLINVGRLKMVKKGKAYHFWAIPPATSLRPVFDLEEGEKPFWERDDD